MATPDVALGPSSRRILRLRERDGEQVPEIVVDHWQRLRDDEPYPALELLPVLVSFARLVSEREQLAARSGAFGVWLPGHAEPEEIAETA